MPTGRANARPGDRLRDAIHLTAERKNGLLRRFRLRLLSYGGQVAPRNDGEGLLRLPRALFAAVGPSKARAHRAAGMRMHALLVV